MSDWVLWLAMGLFALSTAFCFAFCRTAEAAARRAAEYADMADEERAATARLKESCWEAAALAKRKSDECRKAVDQAETAEEMCSRHYEKALRDLAHPPLRINVDPTGVDELRRKLATTFGGWYEFIEPTAEQAREHLEHGIPFIITAPPFAFAPVSVQPDNTENVK